MKKYKKGSNVLDPALYPFLLVNPLKRYWRFLPGQILEFISVDETALEGDEASKEAHVDQRERASSSFLFCL